MIEVILYVREDCPGEFIAWEKHPISGGKDMPICCRSSVEDALISAREFLDKHREGCYFKAERSVVGA